MDPTQRFDPNRTMLTGAPGTGDPMKTMAMNPFDPIADFGKTQAIDPAVFGGKSVRAEIIPGRVAAMANGPAREQFLVQFTAIGDAIPGLSTGARTPLNLCLVIDRSGSMEGPPLDFVKQACSYVVDLLTPNDVLSIVTFEEVVDVLMPAQRVTNKQLIKDGIMRLAPGNTTNLYDGLSLAVQQVTALNDPGRATRMIVLTDGDPTAGIKDFSALVQHAGDIKSRGITCTFLGFGPDYNEELLASMAKRAGGNYYYISQPNLIPEIFRTELEKLMTVVAQNLKLDVKLARWVSARSPQIATQAASFSVQLTDLERGATLEQVFDLEMSNHPLGWYRIASGKLTYDDTATGGTEVIDLDLVIEFSADSAAYSAPQDPRVKAAAQVAQASRVVEKTILGMKTGVLTQMGAMQELEKTQALLLGEGRVAEAQEVTMALNALRSGDNAGAEKTLMGTVFKMDQGKKS